MLRNTLWMVEFASDYRFSCPIPRFSVKNDERIAIATVKPQMKAFLYANPGTASYNEFNDCRCC